MIYTVCIYTCNSIAFPNTYFIHKINSDLNNGVNRYSMSRNYICEIKFCWQSLLNYIKLIYETCVNDIKIKIIYIS